MLEILEGCVLLELCTPKLPSSTTETTRPRRYPIPRISAFPLHQPLPNLRELELVGVSFSHNDEDNEALNQLNGLVDSEEE